MTPSLPFFTFVDDRTGDTYNVNLTDDGEFQSAVRYIDRVGGDKVDYWAMGELPPQHRAEIEYRIARRRVGK